MDIPTQEVPGFYLKDNESPPNLYWMDNDEMAEPHILLEGKVKITWEEACVIRVEQIAAGKD